MEERFPPPPQVVESTITRIDGEVFESCYFFLLSEWGKLGGSGSVVSTANDMTKWLKFQLASGQAPNGQQLVPADLLAETHKAHNVIPVSATDRKWTKPNAPVTYSQNEYALGWRTGHYKGQCPVLYKQLCMVMSDNDLLTSFSNVNDHLFR